MKILRAINKKLYDMSPEQLASAEKDLRCIFGLWEIRDDINLKPESSEL